MLGIGDDAALDTDGPGDGHDRPLLRHPDELLVRPAGAAGARHPDVGEAVGDLVVETERSAIEDRHIRGFFLANESRDLRV